MFAKDSLIKNVMSWNKFWKRRKLIAK